jgi:hypothetical protein
MASVPPSLEPRLIRAQRFSPKRAWHGEPRARTSLHFWLVQNRVPVDRADKKYPNKVLS